MIRESRISIITSLYKCEKYLHRYFNAVLKMADKVKFELIIIHNEPTEEEVDIINIYIKKLSVVKYFKVPLEGLYASWNRAIMNASGKYLTIWNVDDIRFGKPIILQSKILGSSHKKMHKI